jgi:hypothetical protein
MSSGSKTPTTSGTSEPWKAAQPALKTGLSEATNIFKEGSSFKPFQGSTVVPFSEQTTQGMNDVMGRSNAAMSGINPFDKAFGYAGGVIDGGGMTDDMKGVMDQWKTTASGAEMGMMSPAFQDVLSRVQGDTRDQVNLSASGAGRYGSGMHTGVLADRVGDVTARMNLDEYGRQMGRMDTARGNIFQGGNTGISNAMNAGASLPALWEGMNAPATDAMKVGSMYEDLFGRTLDDKLRIFEGNRDAPKAATEWLNAIASGAGALGGTQSGRTTAPAPNPFLQGIAGVSGLNNLFGNPIGQMTGSVVPFGAPLW